MLLSSSNFNDSRKSILIVDDDEMIVELLSLAFENSDFKVFKAENGLDAWQLFSIEHMDFVLTDIQMPGMNGKDLSQLIRNLSPSTKIAVMTGGETDVAAELLKDGSADYFFPKPFKIKKICEILIAEAQVA